MAVHFCVHLGSRAPSSFLGLQYGFGWPVHSISPTRFAPSSISGAKPPTKTVFCGLGTSGFADWLEFLQELDKDAHGGKNK